MRIVSGQLLSGKLLSVLLLCLLTAACKDSARVTTSSIVSLHTELGGDAQGYKRACGPKEFTFPQDHLAHPEYRNEWWYITGNVASDDATRFGFHATIFRIATRPLQPDVSDSNWETSQFYMGHFALSREGDTSLHASERFARSAAGLAGTSLDRQLALVWLEDWAITQTRGGDRPAWRLRLSDGDGTAVDLQLNATKPYVLQGTRGYSQKSADPCNASYYYAFTRLYTDGSIVVDGRSFKVSGSAWFDREWSSSALADNQIGWDWFALQFNDGRDVMFYQLRETDGAASAYSSAVEVDANGTKREIPLPDLQVKRWWKSPAGASYPVQGRLTRSDTGEVINFSPLLDNQELELTVRYWEGAIILTDERGMSIGRGYLELTGY